MTQHVRKRYQNHRKAAWGIAFLLALALAAIAIPIASADDDDDDDDHKTYTLGFAPSSTLSKTLCQDAGSVDLILKNTSHTTLGSTEDHVPELRHCHVGRPHDLEGASCECLAGQCQEQDQAPQPRVGEVSLGHDPRPVLLVELGRADEARDRSEEVELLRRRRLLQEGLVARADRHGLRHDLRSGLRGPGSRRCVRRERNSARRATGLGSLTLQEGQLHVRVRSQGDRGGERQLHVHRGLDREGLPTLREGDRSRRLEQWALQKPTGNTNCAAISPTSPATSAAIEFTPLAGSATGQDFAVVPVTAPVPCGGQSEVTDYLVELSTANCAKNGARYVQYSFVDGTTFYFNFTPAPGATGGEVLLVEKLESTFDVSKGQGTVLKYDDVAPFDTYVEMLKCLTDPRQDPENDKLTLQSSVNESAVLPGRPHVLLSRDARVRTIGGQVHAHRLRVLGRRRGPAGRLGHRAEALVEAFRLDQRLVRVLRAPLDGGQVRELAQASAPPRRGGAGGGRS